MKVYGIKNCNTVKKAILWLEKNKLKFDFHDYKKEGIDAKTLKSWIKQVGWEALVNTKGTTWRQLPESVQKKITNANAAIALMMDKHSVIKRPLIEIDNQVILLGFDENTYRQKLK